MAYESRVISPSGATFATLKTGLRSVLAASLAANSLSTKQAETAKDFGPQLADAQRTIDNFLQGNPVPIADVKGLLLDAATSLKLQLAVVEEACVLVDANPGTIVTVARPQGDGWEEKRQFA